MFEKCLTPFAFRRVLLIVGSIQRIFFLTDAFGQPVLDEHGNFLAKPLAPLTIIGFEFQDLTEAA
jgi:hypothetical protein